MRSSFSAAGKIVQNLKKLLEFELDFSGDFFASVRRGAAILKKQTSRIHDDASSCVYIHTIHVHASCIQGNCTTKQYIYTYNV